MILIDINYKPEMGRMERTKKAFARLKIFEAILISCILLNKAFRVIPMSIELLAAVSVANIVVLKILMGSSLRKDLKDYSPGLHERFYKNFPMVNRPLSEPAFVGFTRRFFARREARAKT